MTKKKVLLFIISICLLLPMVFGLAACGNENIELSETEIEVTVDGYEGFSFTTSKKYEIKSSDESIAKISSTQRGTGSLSDYVFATVKGISNGNCEVTVKVGGTTETIKVTVGFIPEITVQQISHYDFNIQTNFPVGTNLELTLNGNGYSSSQVVTLEKQSWYYSHKGFTFGEEITDGTYTLTVNFDDFANQPQEAKNVLGANGEYVLGDKIKVVDGVKVLETTYTVELPYLTMEEKIAATPYTKLTTEQIKYIKKWIDARYDYYDDLNGKYQGDKYTDTIFTEAAELFNKTKSEISAIWANPNVSLYD